MTESEARERAWLAGLPKAEIHLHLEGAIPLSTLWKLMEKYGGDPEVPDMEALSRRFVYRDFPHFISTWIWKNRFLREYEDFTLIAEGVARELVSQNVKYAEVFYSPPEFQALGLSIQGITTAIRKGLERVPQARIALITDLVRDLGPEEGARTLAKALEVRDQGVIGIGIGGMEKEHPAGLFTAVYAQARRAGLHVTAHAGEADGASSVRAAVEKLEAERIGHGTRAFEDPSLVELLARRRIPLEMCPISNLRTGAVARLEDHPIRRYFLAGIPVTVNTDDPAMFSTSLVEELYTLRTVLGFSREEVLQVVKNGFACSWAPAEIKERFGA